MTLESFKLTRNSLEVAEDSLMDQKILFFTGCRVNGIQNDRLELMVSTKQLVLKNKHRILSYRSKYSKIGNFSLVSPIWTHIHTHLWIRCIFSKPDYCFETLSSSWCFEYHEP